MDLKTLSACTGASTDACARFAPHLSLAMADFGIDGPRRVAAFLATISHESARMTRLVESLNYSVESLLSMFGRHRISEADARTYGRTPGRPANQRAIANCIYGGPWGRQNLGNDLAGDGFLFIGRGLIQLTGKGNARALRDRLATRLHVPVPDFVRAPEALALPEWAAWAAASFWDMNGLSAYADRGDFDGVADLVNKGRKTQQIGDAIGFDERSRLYRGALTVLS